ncbi:MAG: hypothetical protein ACRBDL_02270 [Alphaproteobacteria bacterium]
MAEAAAHHGHSDKKMHSGDLTKKFGSVAMKTAGVAVKAVALYTGFIFVDGFFDFGLIHSEGWAESGLGALSKEFLSPVTASLPEFVSEGFGAEMLTMLKTTLKSIHRAFGVTDTFIDKPSVTQSSDADTYGGSLSGFSDSMDDQQFSSAGDTLDVLSGDGSGADAVLDALENL